MDVLGGSGVDLFVGSPFRNAPSRDMMETFVLCRVLPVKAVHLRVAVDYFGLFILLLSQELKKKRGGKKL